MPHSVATPGPTRPLWPLPLAAQVMSLLAAALAANTGLRTLSLAGSRIGSAGAAALAAALATNSTLAALNLAAAASAASEDAAGGGGGGGSAASAALSVCGGPDGRIADPGVSALAAALARNASLRELNLCGCRCGEAGGAALAQALRANRALRVLDLGGDGGEGVGTGGREGARAGAAEGEAGGASGVNDAAATHILRALAVSGAASVLDEGPADSAPLIPTLSSAPCNDDSQP